MITIILTLSFAFLAIIAFVVVIVLALRRSEHIKSWQHDEVYDRLKMLEDGWSHDEVLAHKRADENSDDVSV